MKIWLIVLGLLLPLSVFAQSEYKMNPAERKQLDTFFSNFSETGLPSFTQGALTSEVLSRFAVRHAYINDLKSLKKSKDGFSVLVPAEQVDAVTDKYFGTKIRNHAQKEYSAPLADGEAYVFSQIKSLQPVGDDRFRAAGEIYSTGSGGTPDPHGTPEQWAKAGETVDSAGMFTALIQKVKTGKEHWIILEYHVVDRE